MRGSIAIRSSNWNPFVPAARGQAVQQQAMKSIRLSDATTLTLVEPEAGLESFVNDRSASIRNIGFNDRRAIVHRIADLLDARISRCAEKYDAYDLIVDSIGNWLVVATALWHPMFLCREYLFAVTEAIGNANASEAYVVTNHFEYYGDASDWGFDFTELKFDFAVAADTIAVSGVEMDVFIDLVDRTGSF